MKAEKLRNLLGPEPLVQISATDLLEVARVLKGDLQRVDHAIRCLEELRGSSLRPTGQTGLTLVINDGGMPYLAGKTRIRKKNKSRRDLIEAVG